MRVLALNRSGRNVLINPTAEINLLFGRSEMQINTKR